MDIKTKQTILVASSNITNLKVLEAKLLSLGYHVVKVTQGQKVADVAVDIQPQVILLDNHISDIDRNKICRTIKQRSETKRILVVFITSMENGVAHVAAVESGADEFIYCPFDQVILSVRLKALLKTKKMSEEFADLQTELELKIAERTVESIEASDAGLFALAKLAESRDIDTGQHLDRIRRYSVILANTLSKISDFYEKIVSGFVADIYRSSPLHDIGKVGIPDSILLKPGVLTKEEFEIMKTHTTIGANILKEAYTMMQDKPHFELSWVIALTHHEKYDGTGYPNGLKEKDIPLAGRIAALSDVYDALVSKRVYKKAFPHEKSKNIIVSDSGIHFDPEIVKAFLQAENQFLEVKDRFSSPD